VVAFFL